MMNLQAPSRMLRTSSTRLTAAEPCSWKALLCSGGTAALLDLAEVEACRCETMIDLAAAVAAAAAVPA